jgi:hypothetical protein
MTWNMAGLKPTYNFDISQFILPVDSATDEPPDFYVVGLQEMVDLTAIGAFTCPKDKDRMA